MLADLGTDPPRMEEDGQDDQLTYTPLHPPHVRTHISADGRGTVGTNQAFGAQKRGKGTIFAASGGHCPGLQMANFPVSGGKPSLRIFDG